MVKINKIWLICLTLLGGAASCGIFYALYIGGSQQALLLQACSVGIGVFVSAALGLVLPDGSGDGNRPVWPLLIPLAFGAVSTGALYAFTYGSPKLAQVMGSAGISNGVGMVAVLLVVALLRKPAVAQVALADEAAFSFDNPFSRCEPKGSGWEPDVKLGHGHAENRSEAVPFCDPPEDIVEQNGSGKPLGTGVESRTWHGVQNQELQQDQEKLDQEVGLSMAETENLYENVETCGPADMVEYEEVKIYGEAVQGYKKDEALKECVMDGAEQGAPDVAGEKTEGRVPKQEPKLDPHSVLELVKTLVDSVEQIDQKMLRDVADRADRIATLAGEYLELKARIEEQLAAAEKNIVEADSKVKEILRVSDEIKALVKR